MIAEPLTGIGDDRRAGGVDLEVRLRGFPPAFIADVGGLSSSDHDAVRRVADANLRALRQRRRGQVDLGERVVLVQQRVGALAVTRRTRHRRDTKCSSNRTCRRNAVVADRAIREARDETVVRRHRDLGVVGQQARWATTLAMAMLLLSWLNIRYLPSARIGDAAIAAAGIPERQIVLQDYPGLGVEYLDGLARTQGQDRGGVGGGIGIQRNRLGADPDAEVDLLAGRVDDLAVAHHVGTVRPRARRRSGTARTDRRTPVR